MITIFGNVKLGTFGPATLLFFCDIRLFSDPIPFVPSVTDVTFFVTSSCKFLLLGKPRLKWREGRCQIATDTSLCFFLILSLFVINLNKIKIIKKKRKFIKFNKIKSSITIILVKLSSFFIIVIKAYFQINNNKLKI